MAHFLSGIITTFKYTGDLPHIYLKDNYALIAFSNEINPFQIDPVESFSRLTSEVKGLIIELSYIGRCAFIETEYFCEWGGGQSAMVWDNGKCIFKKAMDPAIEVGDAINQALKMIGVVSPNADTDEFDTLELGCYRSNEEVIQEFLAKKNEQ